MKILLAVGLILIGFFLCQLSFGQDTAVHGQPVAEPVIHNTPVRDSTAFRNPLTDTTVQVVTDSVKAAASHADSVFSDSVKRYWKGWRNIRLNRDIPIRSIPKKF